jgi:hypothetical protein
LVFPRRPVLAERCTNSETSCSELGGNGCPAERVG